jgi:mevalonate kinase
VERTFYSHGKLLLTSEYVVLDGAMALAIPTKKGQTLKITHTGSKNNCIHWRSFTVEGDCWFEDTLSISQHGIVSLKNTEISKTLCEILLAAQRLNPLFLNQVIERTVVTQLEFPKSWGLGSSSTLINNIAQWAAVDAFSLLFNSFKGSGYDIAAAQMHTAFLYQVAHETPSFSPSPLAWTFTDQLFFIYLNKKQDSKEGISHYKTKRGSQQIDFKYFSAISEAIIAVTTLDGFKTLVENHERAISEIIEMPTVKELLFSEYSGAIKSLGAWGGDFVLATGTAVEMRYFKEKGYETVIPFSEMCL